FGYGPLEFRRVTKPVAAFAAELKIFWIYKLAFRALHITSKKESGVGRQESGVKGESLSRVEYLKSAISHPLK
ncbi:MAG: hypothetical protein PVI74_09935, partial [Syntrophobacterales bacterium]